MRRTSLLVPLTVASVFAALVALQPVTDSDLFWHLATGQRTLASGLPRTDVFAWTISGRPVLVDQWLGDALTAAAYALGSWRGIIALRALGVFALVAFTVGGALAAAPRRPLVAVLVSLPAVALSRFVWTDRPELLGFAFFAALLVVLRDSRDRVLVLVVPLLLVWANAHGSYALGLALTLVVCAVRVLDGTTRRRAAALIAVAAIAATLLTPAGLATWTSSGGHFLAPPRYIAEEGVPDLHTAAGVLFAISLALVLATAFLSRGTTWREAAVLVPVTFVALTATRYTPYLAIAAAPYLAAHLPVAVGAARREPTPADPVRPPRWADALGALVAFAVVALGVALAPSAPDETAYPVDALPYLSTSPGLLNTYEWGGWLDWRGVPVFIDGRLFPFVPDVLDDYRAIVGLRSDWQDVIARRGVRALLVRPTDAVAVHAVEMGWRVVSSNERYVLLVRQ